MDNIELAVKRKLPAMTMRAEIVRASYLNLSHGSENAPGTQLAIQSHLTAGARLFPLLRAGRFALQPLAQSYSPDLMKGRAQSYLNRFQIQAARFTVLLKDQRQQTAYFVSYFLLDRFRRFFSCGVSVCSRGRRLQIFSLRVMISEQSS